MRTSTIVWAVVLGVALWWLWSVVSKQHQVATSSAAARPATMPLGPAAPASAPVDYSGTFANTTGWSPPPRV